jgi:hypothetical protein
VHDYHGGAYDSTIVFYILLQQTPVLSEGEV